MLPLSPDGQSPVSVPATSRCVTIFAMLMGNAHTPPQLPRKQLRRGGVMRTRSAHAIRITHRPSGQMIAEGPVGFRGVTPFEGNLYRNLYISRKILRNRSSSAQL